MSFRTRICPLRLLHGVEDVARTGAVVLVLVAGGRGERALELVTVLLARLVGPEIDRAVLVRERAEVQRAVVGVPARRGHGLRAVGTVPDREPAAVDDPDRDLRRE